MRPNKPASRKDKYSSRHNENTLRYSGHSPRKDKYFPRSNGKFLRFGDVVSAETYNGLHADRQTSPRRLL